MMLLVLFAPGAVSADFSKLSPPRIGIAGLHSPSWTEQGPRLVCRVKVDNPNNRGLEVNDAVISLKLAGAPAATGVLPQPVTIPANASSEVDIVVNVLPAAALTWMPMFLGSANFSVPYNVSGVIEVDDADIGVLPFDESGEVEMTRDGIKARPSR
jgi:LEA14-like dessication related protein